MTAPATREEVVETGARAMLEARDWQVDGQPEEATGWDALGPEWQDAYRVMFRGALTALEQSGIILVPAEATEEIMDAINSGRNAPLDDGQIWNDAIAASPYKKEQTNG